MNIETDAESNIIYTFSSGTLTKEDMEKLLPILKETIEKHGKARWYYEMKDFNGWEVEAFWEDIKFDFKHSRDFEKITMVGEKKWQDWMTQTMKPFSPAEIKYFDLTSEKLAKEWIESIN